MTSPTKLLEHDTNHAIEKHVIEKHVIAIAGIIMIVILYMSSDRYRQHDMAQPEPQQIEASVSCSLVSISSQTKVQERTPSGGCKIASYQ